MRKAIIVFGLLAASAAVFTQVQALSHPIIVSVRSAVFNWSQTVFDFGDIKHNKPVSHIFKFRNTGNAPLIISSVQASCGCTVTDYSKEPIEPGGEGYVKATYNAAKVGVFNKTVSVNANTDDGAVNLTIKGNVIE